MKHRYSNQFMDGLTAVFAMSGRIPILRRPDEYGMAYEDIFFPSLDGVGLEGWFIPSYSDHLVICSHCMSGNRYGYPGHLEPWTSFSGVELCDNAIQQWTGVHLNGLSPITLPKAMRMPTLLVQVRNEVTTRSADVEAIYNNMSAKDKKLFWIEGTTRRFDGYNYLAEHPELMLEWFKAHMN